MQEQVSYAKVPGKYVIKVTDGNGQFVRFEYADTEYNARQKVMKINGQTQVAVPLEELLNVTPIEVVRAFPGPGNGKKKNSKMENLSSESELG